MGFQEGADVFRCAADGHGGGVEELAQEVQNPPRVPDDGRDGAAFSEAQGLPSGDSRLSTDARSPRLVRHPCAAGRSRTPGSAGAADRAFGRHSP